MLRPAFLSCLLLPLIACSSESKGAMSEPAPSSGSAAASQTAPVDAPAMATSNTPNFQSQDGWTEEPTDPAGMRFAQYRLPAQGEDPEDAQLVVYLFPSSGSVEMNFDRWARQLAQPDGSDPVEAAVRSEREVRGMRVHQLDCSGRYVAETMPGTGDRVDKPNWRLLAAVVESGDGPYYVKLTGPEATVAHWKSSYEAFLSAM